MGDPKHGAAEMEEVVRRAPGEGVVDTVGLEKPSARHLGLVGSVAEQREPADALVGVVSLYLRPGGTVR